MIFHILLSILFITPVYLQDIDPTRRISASLNQLIKTGIKPKDLDEAVTSLQKLKNETYRNEQTCRTCKYVVDGVLQYRRSGVDKQSMIKLFQELCAVFTSWGKVGCKGYSELKADALLYMIDNKKTLTPDRVCAIYLQKYHCEDPNSQDWHVNLPEELPGNVIPFNKNEIDTLKILHLTDIHFDLHYLPGSNAVCDEPLCCRGGTPEKPENAAGYWGDYNVCDMPWHSVLDLMDQVKKQQQQIDYVYYTGDIISHASWITTKETNEEDIKKLHDLFFKTFGSIPVYSVLGNHESHPSDFYSPENVSTVVSSQWLYDLVADDWSKWLPEDTKTTIKKGGYYTVLVKKGFRIIGLNSNICYIDNLWLLYEDVDPQGQLQWLSDTLAEAEKNGEAVHILAHVPPGSLECWRKWGDEYNRIVKRFSHIIKAQFNGHTHIDELKIFLNDDNTNAINVAYNGGSFTTFVGMNPNYRVYDVDRQSFEVLDYQQWIFNLTEANQSKDTPPDWYKLYSFKEAYGLNSTSMEDLFDWIRRMQEDPQKDLMKQYFRFQVRESEVQVNQGCDNDCLNTLLCLITNLDFKDAIKC